MNYLSIKQEKSISTGYLVASPLPPPKSSPKLPCPHPQPPTTHTPSVCVALTATIHCLSHSSAHTSHHITPLLSTFTSTNPSRQTIRYIRSNCTNPLACPICSCSFQHQVSAPQLYYLQVITPRLRWPPNPITSIPLLVPYAPPPTNTKSADHNSTTYNSSLHASVAHLHLD